MISLEKYKDIWVYIETEGKEIKNVGLELLNPGRKLADELNEKLVAVIIGENIAHNTNEIFEYGADDIIVVEGEEYGRYTTDGFTNVLDKLVKKYKPSTLLIPATNNGRDLGPRLASRLRTGLTADCTGIDVHEETRNIAWIRPAFGGKLMATILCSESRPQIGTVRPSVFKKVKRNREKEGNILFEEIKTPANEIRTKFLEYIKLENADKINLEEAEIIVAGGRGLGKPENLNLIRDLANLLGGSMAVSRAVVDEGWIDHIYQIGQTGKTVGPKIYIACGISGATQHLVGISSSDTIIAINIDENAPIFNIADFGIVGDILEIIPILIKELSSSKLTKD